MTDLLLPNGIASPGVGLPAPGRPVEEFDGLLCCTAITEITHDVRSFTFTLEHGQVLDFLPGQYLTLAVPVDSGLTERCYTISSPPSDRDSVTITVKRVPGGPVSNWLHDQLRIGDTLSARGPLGVFSSDHHPAQNLLLLSAGSGITPMMSMLRELVARDTKQQVHFVHCARTPDDIIFGAELVELAMLFNVEVTVLCEADSPTRTWSGPRGRLNAAALVQAAPTLLDAEIFTCGPAPYMAAVRDILHLLGADPARCHEESFVLGAASPVTADDPPAGSPAASSTTHRVEFRRSGRVIDCDPSTSLLTAAQAAGIPVPSSCGEGVCGTCKQDLLDGEVDMQHAGGIRPKEIRQGKVLLCSARPTSDLIIDA